MTSTPPFGKAHGMSHDHLSCLGLELSVQQDRRRQPAPALFSGIRFITAGTLLALIARFVGGGPWPARPIEWRHVIVTGFFMVLVSNGLNIWAIQFIPSNQSALLNSTPAFWIAGLGVFGKRGHPLTRWAVLGLMIGFLGVALMLIPKGAFSTQSALAQAGVLVGCFSWSLGTCTTAASILS